MKSHSDLISFAKHLVNLMDMVVCYSVKGDGVVTSDCDIAIDVDTLSQNRSVIAFPSEVVRMWTESVPYARSYTRYKFIVNFD